MLSQMQEIHKLLTEKSLTVTTAESLTGGMLASFFTELPGSTSYFHGGIVSYAERIKKEFLNVSEKVLEEKSAVSAQCAQQMAEGCLRRFESDFSISLTGLAGPDGDSRFPDIPVGRVYIGIACKNGTVKVFQEDFPADLGREAIRKKTCERALEHLKGMILQKN